MNEPKTDNLIAESWKYARPLLFPMVPEGKVRFIEAAYFAGAIEVLEILKLCETHEHVKACVAHLRRETDAFLPARPPH
jgi:hypothetical protein